MITATYISLSLILFKFSLTYFRILTFTVAPIVWNSVSRSTYSAGVWALWVNACSLRAGRGWRTFIDICRTVQHKMVFTRKPWGLINNLHCLPKGWGNSSVPQGKIRAKAFLNGKIYRFIDPSGLVWSKVCLRSCSWSFFGQYKLNTKSNK